VDSRPNPRTAPAGDPISESGSLSQSVIRRRRAQRAFEDRVRAMARRAQAARDGGAGARRPLARV
jgi:hypothetical protein